MVHSLLGITCSTGLEEARCQGLPGLQSQGQASKGRIERPADHPAPSTLQNMLGLSFPIWIVNCTQHHMRARSMSRVQGSSDGDHGCLFRLRVRIPPLYGAAGFGTKQVPEQSLELWVLEGLQAAGDPEGDIP